MSGSIYIYISNKNGAHKIPKPRYSNHSTIFRAIANLANKEVLLVILCY
ncbi:hypothetical protein [Clostridium botulinum]|nr:hypothetical protein [Clostridium botulinum]MBY6800072.1 hypothetical protein [Clostridium botulinum]MBY6996688.1 hypothetical protein [Clostridium botulinum]MBY7010396.1 hypothetical protein [Clostridium botulinum]MCR1154386.1 hypothetical protein [Clostridium botulinum]